MSISEPILANSSDGTPVPSCAIDNSVDNSAGNTTAPSSPIIALPIELLMCICDFLPDRKDIVNLSATCQELRRELHHTLVHQDLRSGRLITLKYGLQTRNMKVIKPFLGRYRHLITRLAVTPKEKEVTPNKKAINGKVTAKEVSTQKVNDQNNDIDKAGTINQPVLPVRKRTPPPPTTVISFRDEYLPSLRLIRPLLTSALEKALLAHDLTFAEHLLWHGNKDLLPSLTPVLESVLWTAFNPNTCPSTGQVLVDRPDHMCADPGPVTPIVWTWKTCPLAAVKLLVKFGAKGNRAGVWAGGKKTRKRRRGSFGGNGASVINNIDSADSHSEEDETPETPDVYDGYYHPKTQTPAAHIHRPAMPPGRLWTGLELVTFFFKEACERAAAAHAAAVAVAAPATAGFADSGANAGPAGACAGAAPVAKSRGIKCNLSGSFRNPGSGSDPSPGAGKEHYFFPVICELHVGRGEGSCFKQLVEVLSNSFAHGEILRATSSRSKGNAGEPKAPFLEHDLDNMLKLTEITVPFVKMPIHGKAGKMLREIFEEAEKRRSKPLNGSVEERKRLEKDKKMKTESLTKTQLEGEDEDEDFWTEQQELVLDEGEPEEDEDNEE